MDSFSFPILKTKFHIPREEGNLIERTRLFARLDDGLEGKCILIAAPAGYGKTTLLTQWLKHKSLPAAWVSLDENDDDIFIFLIYLIAAIRTVFPGACPETAKLLHAKQALPGYILGDMFINELSLLEDLIIILDDFHWIQDRQIYRTLARLIRYLPPNIHLVISTRVDPNLLASLRPYQDMVELRSEDLGFTLEEAQAFLSLTLGKVSAKEIEPLVHHTEGWIVGLRLAALSVDGGKNLAELTKIFQKGSYRFLMEYLSTEVLARQTPEIQDFLFRTSILDRFSASLYHSLQPDPTSEQACQTLLRESITAGLFLVSLDDQQEWFRYHALFREFLQYEIQARFSKHDIADWHHRAGKWLATHGWIDEALAHTFAAGEFLEAARLVMHNLHTLLNHQDFYTLERWLAAFSPEQKRKHPALLLGEAYLCYHHHRLPAIPGFVAQASLLLDEDSLQEDEIRALRGNIDALRTQFLYWNLETEQAQLIGEHALSALPETHLYARGTTLALITASDAVLGRPDHALARINTELAQLGPRDFMLVSQLNYAKGLILYLSGNLETLLEVGEFFFQQAQPNASDLFLGRVSYGLGMGYYERNELEKAIESWERLIPLKYRTNYFNYFHGLLGLALAYQNLGLVDEADDYAEKALEFAKEVSQDELLPEAKSFQIRLALLRGNKYVAPTTLIEAIPVAYDFFKVAFEIQALTRIEMLIAQNTSKTLNLAGTLLQTSLEIVRKIHHVPMTIKVLAMQAVVFAKQKQIGHAETTLLKAVELARPRGFVRTFLDLGPEMRDLLNQLITKRVARPYVLQILKAFPPSANPVSLPASTEKSHHPIHLTTREFEILKLLAMRFTDKEIADQLFISSQTVRRHTANIYTKLGVNNRREAVTLARTWNLLSNP